MDLYEQQLTSALQSQIDKRAGKITSLELFKIGYEYLGRSKAVREVQEDLEKLRLEQVIAKRTLGLLSEYRAHVKYLHSTLTY